MQTNYNFPPRFSNRPESQSQGYVGFESLTYPSSSGPVESTLRKNKPPSLNQTHGYTGSSYENQSKPFRPNNEFGFVQRWTLSSSQVALQKPQQNELLSRTPKPNQNINKEQRYQHNKFQHRNYYQKKEPYEFVTFQHSSKRYHQESGRSLNKKIPLNQAIGLYSDQSSDNYQAVRFELKDSRERQRSNFQVMSNKKMEIRQAVKDFGTKNQQIEHKVNTRQTLLPWNQLANRKASSFNSDASSLLQQTRSQLEISRNSYNTLQKKLTKTQEANQTLMALLQQKERQLQQQKKKSSTNGHYQQIDNIESFLRQKAQMDNKQLLKQMQSQRSQKQKLIQQLNKLKSQKIDKQLENRDRRADTSKKIEDEAQILRSRIMKLIEERQLVKQELTKRTQHNKGLSQTLNSLSQRNHQCETKLKQVLQDIEKVATKQDWYKNQTTKLQTQVLDLKKQLQKKQSLWTQSSAPTTLQVKKQALQFPSKEEKGVNTVGLQTQKEANDSATEREKQTLDLLKQKEETEVKLQKQLQFKVQEIHYLTRQKTEAIRKLSLKQKELQKVKTQNLLETEKFSEELLCVKKQFEEFKQRTIQTQQHFRQLSISQNQVQYWQSFMNGELIIERSSENTIPSHKFDKVISIQIQKELLNSDEQVEHIQRKKIELSDAFELVVNECKNLGLQYTKLENLRDQKKQFSTIKDNFKQENDRFNQHQCIAVLENRIKELEKQNKRKDISLNQKEEEKQQIISFYMKKLQQNQPTSLETSPIKPNNQSRRSQNISQNSIKSRPKLLQRDRDKIKNKRTSTAKVLQRMSKDSEQVICHDSPKLRSQGSQGKLKTFQGDFEGQVLMNKIEEQKKDIKELKQKVCQYEALNKRLEEYVQVLTKQNEDEVNQLYECYAEVLEIFNVQWQPEKETPPQEQLVKAINQFSKRIEDLMKSIQNLELQVFKLTQQNIELQDQQTQVLKKCEFMISNAESENDELINKYERIYSKLQHADSFIATIETTLKNSNEQIVLLGLQLIQYKLSSTQISTMHSIQSLDDEVHQEWSQNKQKSFSLETTDKVRQDGLHDSPEKSQKKNEGIEDYSLKEQVIQVPHSPASGQSNHKTCFGDINKSIKSPKSHKSKRR